MMINKKFKRFYKNWNKFINGFGKYVDEDRTEYDGGTVFHTAPDPPLDRHRENPCEQNYPNQNNNQNPCELFNTKLCKFTVEEYQQLNDYVDQIKCIDLEYLVSIKYKLLLNKLITEYQNNKEKCKQKVIIPNGFIQEGSVKKGGQKPVTQIPRPTDGSTGQSYQPCYTGGKVDPNREIKPPTQSSNNPPHKSLNNLTKKSKKHLQNDEIIQPKRSNRNLRVKLEDVGSNPYLRGNKS